MAESFHLNMKFDRAKLEKLTLQKIADVNNESGYRTYLEVPEMVNIVATIIEEELENKVAYASKRVDNLFCFKQNKLSHTDDKGCCSVCGTNRKTTNDYSQYHHALI